MGNDPSLRKFHFPLYFYRILYVKWENLGFDCCWLNGPSILVSNDFNDSWKYPSSWVMTLLWEIPLFPFLLILPKLLFELREFEFYFVASLDPQFLFLVTFSDPWKCHSSWVMILSLTFWKFPSLAQCQSVFMLMGFDSKLLVLIIHVTSLALYCKLKLWTLVTWVPLFYSLVHKYVVPFGTHTWIIM